MRGTAAAVAAGAIEGRGESHNMPNAAGHPFQPIFFPSS